MHDALEVRSISADVGDGLFATRPLAAGTTIFKEYPLVAMQHRANRAAGARVCDRCFRFFGPIDEQIRSVLHGKCVPCAQLPPMPPVPGAPALPPVVGCPGGCSLRFCSVHCSQANFAEHHQLLCPGPCDAPGAGPSPGGSSSAAADSAASLFDGLQLQPTSAPQASLAKFEAHAAESNEIFLLAAKALALVLCRVKDGMSLADALAPFPGPVWWDAVLPPDDAPSADEFRSTLQQLLGESWALLAAVLRPHAPGAAAGIFDDVNTYARIVGSFERRNCAVQVWVPRNGHGPRDRHKVVSRLASRHASPPEEDHPNPY